MRGVAGTWNGKHGAMHDARLRRREAGQCINCKNERGRTIRCESCRLKHNAEYKNRKEK